MRVISDQTTLIPCRTTAISPHQVTISFWNQRRTRPEWMIQRMAMRLAQDGYDPTRPIKVHPDPDRPDHYFAFAGGTRLLAAQHANLDRIYVAIYEGLSEQQLVQLSNQDNERDEAHNLGCVVDRWWWAHTLRVNFGWSHADIATAYHVKERSVYYWLQYADFPQSVLDQFSTKDRLNERHARELIDIAPGANLVPFVSTELIMLEMIDLALQKAGREGPTADQFRKLVEMYNAFLAKAQERYQQITNQRWRIELVSRLAETKALSVAEVDRVYWQLLPEMQQEAEQTVAAEPQYRMKAATVEAERLAHEARRTEIYRKTLANLVLGDARELLSEAPSGARLAVADPPYGERYLGGRNHRRYATARYASMINDDGEAALALLTAVLPEIYSKLADDAILLLWSGDTWLPEFRKAAEDAGFTYRRTLIWVKAGHGAGDLTGDFAPRCEFLIYAVKGNPKLNPPRRDNVLEGNEFLPADHPTRKPVDLLATLIQATTGEGDLILDPFAGIGSVPVTAFQLGRRFWACEIEPHYHRAALDLLYAEVDHRIDELLRQTGGKMGNSEPRSIGTP